MKVKVFSLLRLPVASYHPQSNTKLPMAHGSTQSALRDSQQEWNSGQGSTNKLAYTSGDIDATCLKPRVDIAGGML
jgi:hypothetical protein